MRKPGFLVYQGSVGDIKASVHHLSIKDVFLLELVAEWKLERTEKNRSSVSAILESLIKRKIKIAAEIHAKGVLGEEVFRENYTAACSIMTDFKTGVFWALIELDMAEAEIVEKEVLS